MSRSPLVRPSFLVLAVLGGCKKEEEVADPLADLVAEVGKDGLTLEGPAGTAFEGVTLDVAAGALPEGTTVVLRSLYDATALPTAAERVGQQFEVDLGGEQPTGSVSLTLPFDDGLVDRFSRTTDDVKVWIRDGEGWLLVEPDATAAGQVTLPVEGDTVAAAGVKTSVRDPSCEASSTCGGTAAEVFDAAACAGVGLCGVERLHGVLTDSRTLGIDDLGEAVTVLEPVSGLICVIAVSLLDGKVLGGPAMHPVRTSDRVNTITDGTSNTIVVGAGFDGNVSFDLQDHVSEAQTVAVYSVGAVRSATGVTTLGIDGGKLVATEGKDVRELVDVSSEKVSIVSPREGKAVAAEPKLVLGDGSVRILDANGKELESLDLPSGQSIPAFAPLAAVGDAVAVITSPGGKVAARFVAGAPLELVDLPVAAFDLAFDEEGRLLIASSDTPEVFAVKGDARALNAYLTLRLADGKAGDPATDGRIVRRLLQNPGGGFVALHADGTVSTLALQ